MVGVDGVAWRTWGARWLFGAVTFGQDDEYHAFRYRFLVVLMWSAAGVTALFVVGSWSGLNPILGPHGVSMAVFTLLTLGLWAWLRGRPDRFYAVAWAYQGVCLLEYSSALWWVPVDELRVLWFFVNVPGVFILLGQRAGWAVTLASLVGLVVVNHRLSAPYSSNALATALLSLLYLGVMFHAYADRSLSYFKRMRDYNRQLQALAHHDPLTGLMNARAYYAQCEHGLQTCRQAELPFAVLFVDLDHFKRVNDTWGHAAGDAVLRTVAQALAGQLRAGDALGRIGGEEFSVFLPNTGLEVARQRAEALRAAVQACEIRHQDQVLTITASVGVAAGSSAGLPLASIQAQADAAMYQTKQAGRNRVAVLDLLST